MTSRILPALRLTVRCSKEKKLLYCDANYSIYIDTRDTYGSSDNTFGKNTSTGAGSNTYGSGSAPGYETSSTTGTGVHSSGTGTETIHDSRKGPIDVGPGTSENYGSKSDTYGSNTAGGYGSTNTGSNKINAGPHDSKLANKADPRVDSDLGKLNLLLTGYLKKIFH